MTFPTPHGDGPMPATTTNAPEATEAELGGALIDWSRIHHWRVAHFRPARTAHGWVTPVQGDGAGFPDFVLVHDHGGIVYVELKTRRGRLSPAQELWREAIIRAGGVHRVVAGKAQLEELYSELAAKATRPC